jgi:hypothetical protein
VRGGAATVLAGIGASRRIFGGGIEPVATERRAGPTTRFRAVTIALFAAGLALALAGLLAHPGQSGGTPAASTGGRWAVPGLARDGTPEPTPTPIPPPPTPTPEPTPPPLSEGMLRLRDDMAAAVAGYWAPGDYAVAVTDLQTGETVGVNEDRPQLAACVMNFFVLLRVAMDLQEGRYAQWDVEDLVAATTWSSNATTARALYGIAGGGDAVAGVRRVESLIRETLRLEGAVIDHPPGYPGDTLGYGVDNTVTARSTNEALAALWHNQVLAPGWRDWLLGHLENVKPGLNYLVAAVPGGRVSHKNGFFPYPGGYVDNDVGIVRFEAGGVEYAYAVSFYSEGVARKYDDIALGQELSLLAWRYFTAAYR